MSQQIKYKIKYIEYNNKKYDSEILSLYKSNFLTTGGLNGYQFLTKPIEEHGLLKVLAVILLLFGLFRLITYLFLSLFFCIVVFVIILHYLFFFYCPQQMSFHAQKWIDAHFTDTIYKRMTEFYSNKEGNTLFLAIREDTDEVVGMAALEKETDQDIPDGILEKGTKAIQLMRVSVNNNYQRQGIASSLLNLAEEKAKSNNYSYIFLAALKTNAPALKLYSSYGFKFLTMPYKRPLLGIILGIQTAFMLKKL